jgi:4-azaleucine resistance transporter AzlC
MRDGPWLRGLRDGVPIALGYLPVGVTFGVVATQQGMSAAEATLTSLIVYSGAAQFMLVGLLAAGTPMALTVGLCLLLNARHALYGPAIAAYLPATPSRLAGLAFGLTDEVFAVALGRLPQQPAAQRPLWLAGVEAMAYASWVGASAAGALAGDWIRAHLPLLAESLPIALSALFLVLLLPHAHAGRRGAILVTVVLAAAFAWAQRAALGLLLAAVVGAVLVGIGEARCARKSS